jgi:hypothetical protein
MSSNYCIFLCRFLRRPVTVKETLSPDDVILQEQLQFILRSFHHSWRITSANIANLAAWNKIK